MDDNLRKPEAELVVPGRFNPSRDGSPYRFDYAFGGTTVSSLFMNRSKSGKSLVVLLNGAVVRNDGKDPREIFQRRTWAPEIDSPLLLLSDPTIQPDNDLQIGWMQGRPTRRPLFAMVQCVKEVCEHMQIRNENVIFFGSSAGGFQALQLHASYPGSRFLVNNAQFDWSKYYEKYVNAIVSYAYPGLSIDQVKNRYPSAVNVLNRFLLPGSALKGEYLVNIASPIDYEKQLTVLNAFLDRVSKKAIAGLEVQVGFYRDSDSLHFPMKQELILAKLNSTIRAASQGTR